jgi:hypothetical protein
MKLSHRLIDICVKLLNNSTKNLIFFFFAGERGLYFDGLTAAIRRRLPDANVVRYQPYNTFLKEIALCDISLATFPFGNTNSTVDTSLLGLPTVAHFGPEPSAQTDKLVINSSKLPNWTICHSDDEYYETALKLIEDQEARSQASGSLSRDEILKNLFPEESSDGETSLRDMLWSVYHRHESIMQGQKRVFTHAELLDS